MDINIPNLPASGSTQWGQAINENFLHLHYDLINQQNDIERVQALFNNITGLNLSVDYFVYITATGAYKNSIGNWLSPTTDIAFNPGSTSNLSAFVVQTPMNSTQQYQDQSWITNDILYIVHTANGISIIRWPSAMGGYYIPMSTSVTNDNKFTLTFQRYPAFLTTANTVAITTNTAFYPNIWLDSGDIESNNIETSIPWTEVGNSSSGLYIVEFFDSTHQPFQTGYKLNTYVASDSKTKVKLTISGAYPANATYRIMFYNTLNHSDPFVPDVNSYYVALDTNGIPYNLTSTSPVMQIGLGRDPSQTMNINIAGICGQSIASGSYITTTNGSYNWYTWDWSNARTASLLSQVTATVGYIDFGRTYNIFINSDYKAYIDKTLYVLGSFNNWDTLNKIVQIDRSGKNDGVYFGFNLTTGMTLKIADADGIFDSSKTTTWYNAATNGTGYGTWWTNDNNNVKILQNGEYNLYLSKSGLIYVDKPMYILGSSINGRSYSGSSPFYCYNSPIAETGGYYPELHLQAGDTIYGAYNGTYYMDPDTGNQLPIEQDGTYIIYLVDINDGHWIYAYRAGD